jgi:hypothetical protein
LAAAAETAEVLEAVAVHLVQEVLELQTVAVAVAVTITTQAAMVVQELLSFVYRLMHQTLRLSQVD